MSAMPATKPEDIDQFSLLELDLDGGPRGVAQDEREELRPIDMLDLDYPRCVRCQARRPLNGDGVCQGCYQERTSAELAALAEEVQEEDEWGSTPEELAAAAAPEFSAIAAESTSNAGVQGIGSVSGGQMQGVGFTAAEGYITSLRNGVKRETGELYIRILREQHGIEFDRSQAALWLDDRPQLPEGAGIVHMPTPGSVPLFERPRAERRFMVGKTQAESERQAKIELRPGELVAGSVAEGNGILVGWRGDRQMTRGALVEALTRLGHAEWAPKPKDARAQAGRAVATLTGYHIKAERKGAVRAGQPQRPAGQHRWFVGKVNDMARPGEQYGLHVLTMTLAPNGELSGTGDQALAGQVIDDYKQRCADELYTSADLTAWMAETLREKCGAVNYAVGWYVPAKHRPKAIELCKAIAATGWGSDWLGSAERPALPIATCDELRDGLVRGLKDEVAQLCGKLEDERVKARADREQAINDAIAAGEDANTVRRKGDIGETRAHSYLSSFRDVGRRALAYGELLGEERVATMRSAIGDAIAELEGLLGEDYSGARERFMHLWDEVEFDLRKARDGDAS